MDFKGKNILFVDFETFYDREAGYDLKSISMTEYVRDARFKVHGCGVSFDVDMEPVWLVGDEVKAFFGACTWKDTVIVAHNVKFDGAILAWRYGVKPYAWFDTQALARAVLGEQVSGHSLKQLAEYLGLPAKGELTCDGVLNPTLQQLQELGTYCKRDVEICKRIYEKIMHQFPQNQLWHVDWTVKTFVEPWLSLNAETLQIGVDEAKRGRARSILDAGIDKKVLSSAEQFSVYLRSIGVEVATKVSTRTGKAIPALAKTDPFLSALQASNPCLYKARLAAKSSLLETRGESLLAVAKTGLFPFDVNFSGAVQTHRYSGGSGAGGNPQNFTRNSFLRSAVGCGKGQSLVVGDFAAIELRILAWLAKEPVLINALINGVDVYSEFASRVYNRPITKADKVERQFGKCAILGLGYGMGFVKFQATVKNQLKIDVSDAEARRTVALYRSTYFNVRKLWDFANQAIPLIADDRISCLHFAPFIKVRKNALVLPSGLTVKYPNLRQVNGEWVYDVYRKKYEAETTKLYGGKLIENICQALAGELCKEAIERAENAGIMCVGQVHDEILAIHPDGDIAAKGLAEAMERSPSWMPNLKLKSEVGYGQTWTEAKN